MATHTTSSAYNMHTCIIIYLLIHLLPGLTKASYDGGREGYRDVERAVEIVVSVAVEGNLDKVFDDCCSSARRIP